MLACAKLRARHHEQPLLQHHHQHIPASIHRRRLIFSSPIGSYSRPHLRPVLSDGLGFQEILREERSYSSDQHGIVCGSCFLRHLRSRHHRQQTTTRQVVVQEQRVLAPWSPSRLPLGSWASYPSPILRCRRLRSSASTTRLMLYGPKSQAPSDRCAYCKRPLHQSQTHLIDTSPGFRGLRA